MTDRAEELAHANELAMLIVDNLPNPAAFEWEHLMAAGRAVLAAGWRPPLPAVPDPHWEISTRVPLSVPVAERQELFDLVSAVVQAWETPDREAEVCGHRADHLWTENRRLRDEIGKLDRQIAESSPLPADETEWRLEFEDATTEQLGADEESARKYLRYGFNVSCRTVSPWVPADQPAHESRPLRPVQSFFEHDVADQSADEEHAIDCQGCDGPGIVPCAADRVIGDFAYRDGQPIKDLEAGRG